MQACSILHLNTIRKGFESGLSKSKQRNIAGFILFVGNAQIIGFLSNFKQNQFMSNNTTGWGKRDHCIKESQIIVIFIVIPALSIKPFASS